MDPDSIKQTIADGVSAKQIGYARKEGARTVLERFGEALSEHEVEISEDVVILKAEDPKSSSNRPAFTGWPFTPTGSTSVPTSTPASP